MQTKSKPKKRGTARAAKGRAGLSAQQTIPYIAMHPDGVCQLPGGVYTKTVEYEDINYSVASTEDQTAIFGGWSSFLNYFDSSLPFQLSFINRRSRDRSRYKVNIPPAEDEFNSVREEYTSMLKNQIAKSNNGIERTKYITFGLPAEGVAEARPRLERVEADVMGNFHRLGVQSEPLDGRDRLALLHSQMHPGNREPFRFSWSDIPKHGLGTKDYIAPDSFDFRDSHTFRVGRYWGAASYLQILASELSDKLLAEILELDAELTVTMHIQTVDQLKAIKTIKGKISDIGRMKAEEQKKAVRAGYDMEILPPDLITFSKDAAELLADLQSRNERMFLLTFADCFCRVFPDGLFYMARTMPQNRLAHQLGAVSALGAHIFMLHLVDFAVDKCVNAAASRPARPFHRAGALGRLLLCQLLLGLVQLFAPLFHTELGLRRLFLPALVSEFGFRGLRDTLSRSAVTRLFAHGPYPPGGSSADRKSHHAGNGQ